MTDNIVLKITVEKRPDGLYRPRVELHDGAVTLLPCCSSLAFAFEGAAKEARERVREFPASTTSLEAVCS